jgi:hypothetical protein
MVSTLCCDWPSCAWHCTTTAWPAHIAPRQIALE